MRQEEYEAIWDGLVDHKVHLWSSHGKRDMPTEIGIVMHEGTDIVQTPTAPGFMRPHEAVQAVFEVMPDGMREKLRAVIVASDAHIRKSGSALPPPNYRHGSLADEFAKDPASQVTEALICVIAEDNRCGGCDIRQFMAEYVVTDGGVMQFSDRITSDGVAGAVVDALQAGFRKESLS